MSHFQRTPANTRINFILPETRVPELHDSCYCMGLSICNFTQLFSKAKKRCSRRASMCLSLSVFRQLFFESRAVWESQTGAKQNLTWNSQSVSFKVRRFGINEKQTTDCVSLYNNAGLISKVSDDRSPKKLKIAVVDNPTVVWRPLPGEPQRISA